MAKIATTQVKKTSAPKKSGSDQKEIEKMAYQFYVERGYQDGFDKEDWARAEKIVKSRKYNS